MNIQMKEKKMETVVQLKGEHMTVAQVEEVLRLVANNEEIVISNNTETQRGGMIRLSPFDEERYTVKIVTLMGTIRQQVSKDAIQLTSTNSAFYIGNLRMALR